MKNKWQNNLINFLDKINSWWCHKYHKVAKKLYLDLPETGPALVVANHVSGLDPLILCAISRRPLRFIVAAEYYNRYGLRWLYKLIKAIPVDRQENSAQALRQALRLLKKGEVVALFPFGGVHLPGKTQQMKAGVMLLALKSNAPIYPVYIQGVKAVGKIFTSLFSKSKISLKLYNKIICTTDNKKTVSEELTKILNNNQTTSRGT